MITCTSTQPTEKYHEVLFPERHRTSLNTFTCDVDYRIPFVRITCRKFQ
jgi:hypothetical protein